MGSERKIPRFWVTSERRGSEWRREARDGREGTGGGEGRGGAFSNMFYGIRGNLREGEERKGEVGDRKKWRAEGERLPKDCSAS